MKYFFLFMPLLLSCSFYCENREISISGLSEGYLIISSESFYDCINVTDEKEMILSISKEKYHYISFYSDFFDSISRYPLGIVVDGENDEYSLNPHLGLLTKSCNDMNNLGLEIDIDNMTLLIDKLEETTDPWIYSADDIKLSLQGLISIGSISKKKVYNMVELTRYHSWIPENQLFNVWYRSIQSFYDKESGQKYRIEITEDGEYIGF